jgi:hypothetical protein
MKYTTSLLLLWRGEMHAGELTFIHDILMSSVLYKHHRR